MLFLLLLIPLGIGLVGYFLGRGKITPRELLIHEGSMLLIIVAGYFIAMSNQSDDVEHWNGVVAKKWKGTQGCCHDYECNCVEVCSGTGSNRSCHKSCQTCYEHSRDVYWEAQSSNGEQLFHDGCNRPSSSPPRRWNQIVVGEPTSIEHSFTNYIKGNPDSILRRQGAAERWKGQLPAYPRVYDLYRADKVIAVGVAIPNLRDLNQRLASINASLGAGKQVNIIVVVTSASDPAYAEGLREAWLGGKKNDLIVIIGTPAFPQISWVQAMSWSTSEEMKISIRDRIAGLGTFDGNKALDIIKAETAGKFVRRRWEDFDYLKSTIEPSNVALIVLFTLGFAVSLGLQIFFWHHDPLDDAPSHFTSRQRHRFARRL